MEKVKSLREGSKNVYYSYREVIGSLPEEYKNVHYSYREVEILHYRGANQNDYSIISLSVWAKKISIIPMMNLRNFY